MNGGKAILTLADATGQDDVCPACRQRRRRAVTRGALTVMHDPPEVYWHGLRADEFTAVQARLLAMLLQFERVSYDALILVLPGEHSGGGALKVHAYNLRRRLRTLTGGQVTLRAIWGEGYEIEFRDAS